MRQLSILFVLLLAAPSVGAQQLAFPGAEGAGRLALGGRGGKVHEVTNLNDSGAGSLRAAVEAKGPRIVVFRVSGTIALKSTLSVKNPKITIAGQSAPGGGICLKDRALTIRADDAVVRYLRVRPGDNAGAELDAISVTEGKNIIVDHCSASWSVDETLSVTGDNLDKVTIQWSIISESLNCSVHSKGCHGYGSLVRGSQGHLFTFHHNLYAHHKARLPRPGNYLSASQDPKGLHFDFRNNVVYDWGGSYAGYNSDSGSVTRMNFVGNDYRSGPSSIKKVAFQESCTTSKGHFAANTMNGAKPADPWSLVVFKGFSGAQLTAYKLTTPLAAAPVTTESAAAAYTKVLAKAGASFPLRDAVDARIVAQVKQGKGKLIDDESEVGGWPKLASTTPPKDSDHDGMPDAWEVARGLDPKSAADGPKDRDSDGYTNVEEYLNCLVATCPPPGQDAGVSDAGKTDAAAIEDAVVDRSTSDADAPDSGATDVSTGEGAGRGEVPADCSCRVGVAESASRAAAPLLPLLLLLLLIRRAATPRP